MNTETLSKMQFDTLKYGGRNTCKTLALFHCINNDKNEKQPEYALMYVICKILVVLKKDILGQDIDVEDIIKVMINDYDANKENFNKSKEYVEKLFKKECK